MGFGENFNFRKLKDGLKKTKDKLFNSISETLQGKAILDEKVYEELEEILVTSDIGYDVSMQIIDRTREGMLTEKDRSYEKVIEILEKQLSKVLSKYEDKVTISDKIKANKPYVMLIIGVNGAGKTTTVAKLAHNFKKDGLKVVIGSADTFRAAANEQLEIWANRVGVEVFQKEKGSDPSAVAFETLEYAINENSDVVIIDTAGRLHTKSNLMEELSKIKRVLQKVIPSAPHDVFLVIDGNTGQNGLVQAKEFSKYAELSGLIITKLDGTAKGGIIFQICSELKIPLKYIGVGESVEDLQSFNPSEFAKAFFE